MSPKTIRIAKLILSIGSAGLTLLAKTNSDKLLDEKIAKKVAEEFAKQKQ